VSQENPRTGLPWWATLAIGVFGPLVGVGIGWWLSAETAREEALRTDQRDAYAALVTVTADCGPGSTVARSRDFLEQVLRDPAISDLVDVNSPEAQAILDELDLSPARIGDCYGRLEGALATVSIISDDSGVVDAAHVLKSAAFELMIGTPEPADDTSPEAMAEASLRSEAEDSDAYVGALVDFEFAARAEARQSVPLLPPSLGRSLASVFLPGTAALLLTGLWLTRSRKGVSDGRADDGAADDGDSNQEGHSTNR
jgi:hypothetical protein